MLVQIKRHPDGTIIPCKCLKTVYGVRFRNAETGDFITEKRVSGDVDTRNLQLKKAAKRLGAEQRYEGKPALLFQSGDWMVEKRSLQHIPVEPFEGFSESVRDCVIFTHATKAEIDAAWYQPKGIPAPRARPAVITRDDAVKVTMQDAATGAQFSALVKDFCVGAISCELTYVAYRFFGTDIRLETTQTSACSAVVILLRPVFDETGEWTREWRADRELICRWEAA